MRKDECSLSDYCDDYYDSDEWEQERENVLQGWDGECERCGLPTDSPHIHHKYGLSVTEYEILCPDCHAKHHNNPEIVSFGYTKQETRCKYCGKKIEWGKTAEGKWIPMEPGYAGFHKCKKDKIIVKK